MNTVRINGQDYTSSLSDTEIAFMGNLSLPTTAQTLSGAIAEHESDISELNSNLGSMLILKDYSFTYSVNANSGANITANQLEAVTPTGYTPLTFYRLATGSASVLPRNVFPQKTGNENMVQVHNISSSNVSNVTLQFSIIYIRSEYIKST